MKKIMCLLLTAVMVIGMIPICSTSVKISAQTEMVKVAVNSENISIQIQNVGTSGTADVVRMDANQYYTTDSLRGLSENITTGTVVGQYSCGTSDTISTSRYDDSGKDYLYSKYYVVQNGKILAGPYYATQITPATNNKTVLPVTTKKGLFSENEATISAVKELGCQNTTININLATFIRTNEDKNGNPITSWPGTVAFESNGKTFHFNSTIVSEYDKQISEYTKAGVNVTLIIVCTADVNYDSYPYHLAYPTTVPQTTKAFNTCDSMGMEYWIATLEFLAQRYTRGKDTGYVCNYIINNEIDYAYDYGPISDRKETLDVYMEEYERGLRLAHLATAKYADDITVSVPTTHAWAITAQEKFYATYDTREEAENSMYGKMDNSYAPLDMFNWLAEKTNKQGAYDWGIASHCYGNSLARSDVYGADTVKVPDWQMTGDFRTTSSITYSNLEALQQYLEQSSLRYNGQVRKVYITEGGVSSFQNSDWDLKNQAAILASTWYKISQLDCVVAYNYYRYVDHRTEVEALFCPGLLDENGKKKPAYDVYKYIDTEKGCVYASKYINNVVYFKNGVRYAANQGNVHSYKDTMQLFNGTFNWNNTWNLNKIYPRATTGIEHAYKTIVVTPATEKKDGKLTTLCGGCGTVKADNADTIKKIKSVTLAKTSYVYDGKMKKPAVTVKDSAGKTVSSNYYTVTYPSGLKNIGKYTVKVQLKDRYSGIKNLSFSIVPKGTKIKSAKKTGSKLKIKWKQQKKQVNGYQIQYAVSSKFKKAKTVTIKKAKNTSKTVTKLKKKKKYYVRIRTYKKVGKTKFYSGWSKKVKTK